MTNNQYDINLNRGLRCPIKNSDFQDVCVINFCKEKNSPFSKESSKKDFSFYTVRYILNGYGYATINGKTIKLVPDMLFVSYPNSNVSIVQDKDEPYTLAWFNLDGAKVKRILRRIGISEENLILQLKPDSRLRNLFSTTPSKCRKHITNSDIIALSAFYSIIDLILEQTCLSDTKSSKSQIHVNAAIQYINDHYGNSELNAMSVSKAISVAPKYLSRIFKQETGIVLGRYITNRRLAAAIELMQKNEYTLSEIARMCGFNSSYYFSTVYKKINDSTPSATLKKYKNDAKKLNKE